MSQTPILKITELSASQSQPEIVVNEAIRILEAMAKLSVVSRNVSAPPGSPADGDCYLIPPGSSGAWTSYPFYVAIAMGGDWIYVPPRVGWIAYVNDEDRYYQFVAGSPSEWAAYDLGALTVTDNGSPTITFSQVRTIQFEGNVRVDQVDANTVKVVVL